MNNGLVILISGRGSNALAILEAARAGWLPAGVRAVIADRPAAGLAAAAARGVDTARIDSRSFPGRGAFEAALGEAIDSYQPGLIALAGFMRVLSEGFVERYAGRMVNIHPSLLPSHRGLDTHARALAAGDTRHGASVHWVTPELDAGPVIARAEVPVQPGDTAERLAARVLEQEHRLYPAVLALLLRQSVSSRHDDTRQDLPTPAQAAADILLLDRDLDARGRLGGRG